MQDAAATNYDFAKNKAADIASAASDKAQEAKGETKVSDMQTVSSMRAQWNPLTWCLKGYFSHHALH